MTTHELKTWPIFFEAITDGFKTFEIRKNDRAYKVGDMLRLREYDPERNEYSGQAIDMEVSYLTDFAQQPGYVVMGLRGRGCGVFHIG